MMDQPLQFLQHRRAHLSSGAHMLQRAGYLIKELKPKEDTKWPLHICFLWWQESCWFGFSLPTESLNSVWMIQQGKQIKWYWREGLLTKNSATSRQKKSSHVTTAIWYNEDSCFLWLPIRTVSTVNLHDSLQTKSKIRSDQSLSRVRLFASIPWRRK